ncbi:MAG: ribonuclease III [Bifidobacteriaceae bacterium]|jgi:ribonuclease-3|nr:ribonuclease III [Bifidobacteriaceae bacterium]
MATGNSLLLELKKKLDPDLLVTALSHRSFVNENGGTLSNERLEFLGDSVLCLVTTTHLFKNFPLNEGELSKLKAAVVSEEMLADVARTHEVGKIVLLGKGEVDSGGREKDSILADTFEAIIGAVYLSNGIEVATEFIHRTFGNKIEELAVDFSSLNWVQSFDTLTRKQGITVSQTRYIEHGADNQKVYEAVCFVDGYGDFSAMASSKKKARGLLSKNAYLKISGLEENEINQARHEIIPIEECECFTAVTNGNLARKKVG